MKFYNANYMKTAWWFGQCSDHSIHIQMILIFEKTVRGLCPCKKKIVNMKQKANEEKKIFTMINNSLQDSTITPKISLLKALVSLQISYVQFYSLWNPV